VEDMGQRVRRALIIFSIGLIGFVLGVAANFIYFNVLPTLIEAFPQVFASGWVAWGFGGALIAIICCLIYVYML
jgi:uncharacterized protein YqhQ